MGKGCSARASLAHSLSGNIIFSLLNPAGKARCGQRVVGASADLAAGGDAMPPCERLGSSQADGAEEFPKESP